MPMTKRDKKVSSGGKAPVFPVRITPELKAQFEKVASDAGMSQGNWLKTLGRKELKRLGIEPKG
ncbi:hypothetical protein [Enterobacter mori]|uniref:hypothetical protein n=1 Tax=Enterobacter mori TaxID=539813 RepID=UPI003B83B17D